MNTLEKQISKKLRCPSCGDKHKVTLHNLDKFEVGKSSILCTCPKTGIYYEVEVTKSKNKNI